MMDLDAIVTALRAGADPNADPAAKRRAAELLRSIASWIEGGQAPPAAAAPPAVSAPPPALSFVSIATAALQVLDLITRHLAMSTRPAAAGPVPFVRF